MLKCFIVEEVCHVFLFHRFSLWHADRKGLSYRKRKSKIPPPPHPESLGLSILSLVQFSLLQSSQDPSLDFFPVHTHSHIFSPHTLIHTHTYSLYHINTLSNKPAELLPLLHKTQTQSCKYTLTHTRVNKLSYTTANIPSLIHTFLFSLSHTLTHIDTIAHRLVM